MQAIQTRYMTPTNTKGARIKAQCDAGTLYVAWDHGLSVEQNHQVAAQELIRKLDWTQEAGYKGDWVGGCLPDGSYAFCLTRGSQQFSV